MENHNFIPAEVIDVSYDDSDPIRNYAISARPLNEYDFNSTNRNSNVIIALPLDAHSKKIPLKHETVYLVKGPSYRYKTKGRINNYYYTTSLSIFTNLNHNALPNISSTANDKQQLGNNFKESATITPLQPFEGDILYEGRFGQSLRFSSTQVNKNNYSVNPEWEGNINGSPITILRNASFRGENNKFRIENINKDESVLYLTSNQKIPLEVSSTKQDGYNTKPQNVKEYTQPQSILVSDRIIINARTEAVLIFGKTSIGCSSQELIFDASKNFIIDSPKIYLGKKDADEPILLGNKTGEWLTDLCSAVEQLIDAITQITVPTGVGPSGTPINSPQLLNLKTSKIISLKNKITQLKSQVSYSK